jgi:hypothetical protein
MLSHNRDRYPSIERFGPARYANPITDPSHAYEFADLVAALRRTSAQPSNLRLVQEQLQQRLAERVG